MPDRATACLGDLDLCYETFGDPQAPPLLLIMGFAGQLVAWPEPLCLALAERGFHVIRYDNRDTGESTWLSDAPAPPLAQSMLRFALARPTTRAPYTIVHLADDAARLLSHLGVGPAHVFGVSMGGMIAQQLALDHPERVASLTTMMSHTGRFRDHLATPKALRALLGTRPTTRARAIESFQRLFTTIGGSTYPADPDELARIGAESYDRGINPAGVRRHMTAILAAPERTRRLKGLKIPTLVIHGTADPLVPVSGGKHTAQTIPGAKLALIEGLGHSLPRGVWPQLIALLGDHAGLPA